ncbi:MAG: hypothetical protein Sv326_0676 [Candidatus Fermentimicrarchaeum limneticum]|uniref:Uncharacterized protein n=1 Tax=Fermentimicrarchaeum limneticum TaxID=2795018 RepID=A0A7D5XCT9_FERL1|nr:MAG: hypothetical protein Sv326_0676 [Candidatus Fermentimicrarchaeum limneticum]
MNPKLFYYVFFGFIIYLIFMSFTIYYAVSNSSASSPNKAQLDDIYSDFGKGVIFSIELLINPQRVSGSGNVIIENAFLFAWIEFAISTFIFYKGVYRRIRRYLPRRI